MRDKLESLLIWLIPALLIQAVAYDWFYDYAPDIWEIIQDSGAWPLLEVVGPYILAIILFILPGIVTAVWVWRLEASRGGRKWLWAAGGLLLEYFVLIFYLGAYFADRTTKSDDKPAA